MQSVQRQFGKLLTRSADGSQVSVLLKDFEDADRMLTQVPLVLISAHRARANMLLRLIQIVDASKAWRDSWTAILGTQHRLVDEFSSIFNPILGAGQDYSGHEPVSTPQQTAERTTRLRDDYEALKTDLLEEVNLVDVRMIKPAMDAKDYVQPMKKTIKHRENKKVDPQRDRTLAAN